MQKLTTEAPAPSLHSPLLQAQGLRMRQQRLMPLAMSHQQLQMGRWAQRWRQPGEEHAPAQELAAGQARPSSCTCQKLSQNLVLQYLAATLHWDKDPVICHADHLHQPECTVLLQRLHQKAASS